MESFTIKAEPGLQGKDRGEISLSKMDIDPTDVKKECSQRSERIVQTPGNIIFGLFESTNHAFVIYMFL